MEAAKRFYGGVSRTARKSEPKRSSFRVMMRARAEQTEAIYKCAFRQHASEEPERVGG